MWRCYEKLFGGVSVMNAESVTARLKNLAVKEVLMPVVESIQSDLRFNKRWLCEKRKWK